MHFINSSANVFSAKVLIGDIIFTSLTGEGTTILCGHLSHAKVQLLAVQGSTSFLSYFKTLSNGVQGCLK